VSFFRQQKNLFIFLNYVYRLKKCDFLFALLNNARYRAPHENKPKIETQRMADDGRSFNRAKLSSVNLVPPPLETH
jgi:hypothetical protein